MRKFWKHIYTNMMAGMAALLPIAGMIYIIMYLESSIAASWLPKQSFYFPGLGIVIVALIIYSVGLTVSTFVGRFIWKRVDSILARMPALGGLYRTFKQMLGYEEQGKAIFKYAVMLKNKDNQGDELGLVTNEIEDNGKNKKIIVFVPGVPNPTSGKLLVIDPGMVTRLSISVNEAIKYHVSIGKSELSSEILKRGSI
jgi:uncharacterized membrane protein